MFDAPKLAILDGGHDRVLRYYIKYDLLVIDDFALRTFSGEEANALYELLIERYEIKSSIFTSARVSQGMARPFPWSHT